MSDASKKRMRLKKEVEAGTYPIKSGYGILKIVT